MQPTLSSGQGVRRTGFEATHAADAEFGDHDGERTRSHLALGRGGGAEGTRECPGQSVGGGGSPRGAAFRSRLASAHGFGVRSAALVAALSALSPPEPRLQESGVDRSAHRTRAPGSAPDSGRTR
jgi:hypothetical protein